MIDPKDITAEVYYKDTVKDVWYAKILYGGIYISGIKVQHSHRDPDGPLWVQMPSYKTGDKWRRYIEFQGGNKQLRDFIEDKCREAVKAYESQDHPLTVDDIENIDIAAELDKAWPDN